MAQMRRQRMLLLLVGAIAVLLLTRFYSDGIRGSLCIKPTDENINHNTITPVTATTPQTKHRIIPSDEVLAKMETDALEDMYWRSVNNIQTVCEEVRRVGSYGDGGKEVCCDEKFLPKKPCLVYSIGIFLVTDDLGSNLGQMKQERKIIANSWSFDDDVPDMFGCEVHCFDPSVHKADHQRSDNIWFHDLGIGPTDIVTKTNWTLRTLATIRKDLGHEHRTLDILKIDVEGNEWETFRQTIDTGTLVDVKQILVEVHEKKDIRLRLAVLRDLHHIGYRIFHRERNMVPHFNKYRWTRHSPFRPDVVELAFLRRQ